MDRHTHARTDAKRFYYLSHAICYSYGADKKGCGYGHVTVLKFLCFAVCCDAGRRAVLSATTELLVYKMVRCAARVEAQ